MLGVNMTTPQWALERITVAKEQRKVTLDLDGIGRFERLTEVPDEVFEIPRLTLLYLSNNNLSKIPLTITKLQNLTRLDLWRNKFTDFPESITNLQHLKTLFISNNQLTDLPASISNLRELTNLDLSYNYFTDMPEAMTSLQRLLSLDLSANRFSNLSFCITTLMNLSRLNLSSNQLSNLPDEIANLRGLTKLELSNNKFSIIPDSVLELRNLTTLDFGNNLLTNLPDAIKTLINLVWLDLSGNNFTGLPDSIEKLQNLTRLYLNSNKLLNFPQSITKLQNLRGLYLGNNQLVNLPGYIAELQDLETLDLNKNRIVNLPDFITELRNLTTLDFSNNQLVELPDSLARMPNLTRLELSGNPLITPPLEVAEKGIDAIREYFRQLLEGQDYLFEAKVLIIGEGGAGKTTLARKIKDPNYQLQDEKSTEGIDVIQWLFPIVEEKNFRVNIWDFGGQEIYHATHQFFLTKRSLYILVADTRKEDTDFFYWLNLVELLSDNSPLLILKNEKQDRHREINERQLRGQFENLKVIMAANLATNRGLKNITDEIQYHITRLPHIGSPLPKTWIRVREDLEKDKRFYISLEEYLEVCKKNGFTETKDGLQLSGYLHDIGVFLHFQDDPLLRKTVILKPKWGTDAVYKALDNKNVIRNLGRFTRADLAIIWNTPQYINMHDELLQLMMKFRLCYQIPNVPGTYIAPQLLTENQANYTWNEKENLLLRYIYEFMPKGILTQFIVSMHPYIAAVSGQSLVWKSGVVIAKDQTAAEVVEHYGKRQIHVRIAGAHKKELMVIIMHELDKIHYTYKRLKFDKLIPCNCRECKSNHEPHFYRFEHLQNFIEKRVEHIQCGISGTMVDVYNLIDDVMGKEHIFLDEQLSGVSQININIAQNAKIGNIFLDSIIQNSFNKTASAEISPDLKETLKQLIQAVDAASKALPGKQAEKVADELGKLVDEATRKTPRERWYSVSIDGLTKAAENLGKVGEPVIELSRKVLSLLTIGLIK